MAIASIRPARSYTSGNVPNVAGMDEGEIATNIPDGIIWQKDDAGVLREIYSRNKHIIRHDPAETYAAGDPIYYDGVIFTAATAAEKGSAVDYSQPPSAVTGDWRLNDTTPLWTLQRATEGWFPAYTSKIRLSSGEEKTLSTKVIGEKRPDVADTTARNNLTQSMTTAQQQANHGIHVYVTGDREYIYNSLDNAWRDFNTFDLPGNPSIDPANDSESWVQEQYPAPAGAGNSIRYVYEYLAPGVYVETYAREDATDLTIPLSDDNALSQWLSPFHPGEMVIHLSEWAHLYIPGVIVMVGDITTGDFSKWILVTDGTPAQKRLNPTDPGIDPADQIYVETTL